jgi:hypothetical protein
MAAQSDGAMFDKGTRERIRRKLLNHMKEHGIGVHRLAARIIKTTPRGAEIPIKTLQRFLGGETRTNDMYVRFFQDFAASLPDADPIGELGRAMAEFHGSEKPDHFGGEYTSDISTDGGPDRSAFLSDLSISADDNFCRVVERSNSGRLVICDGALVAQGRMAVIALQDRTTKAPRQYLLGAEQEGYRARGTEAVFGPNAEPTVHTLSGRISARGTEPERPPGFVAPPPSVVKEGLADSRPGITVPRMPAFIVGSDDQPRPTPKSEEKLTALDRLLAMFKPSRVKPQQSAPFPEMKKETASVEPLEQLRQMGPKSESAKTSDQIQTAFLMAAERADEAEMRKLVEAGADINRADPATGLTALHLSVGRDAIGPVRFLVGLGAKFVPDKYGRMPSTIAAESEVSDEVSDFILEAEAREEGV